MLILDLTQPFSLSSSLLVLSNKLLNLRFCWKSLENIEKMKLSRKVPMTLYYDIWNYFN